MNRGDLLLRWVSCFAEIRAARVQAAAERLCAPPVTMGRGDPRLAPYIRAAKRLTRNLLRVGHVEEQTKERYRTVPPTVVSLATGRHLLIGARTNALLDEYAMAPGVTVPPAAPQHEAPSVWHLVGSDEAVARASEKVGVTVGRDRWGEVLASLPSLPDVLAGAPAEGIPDRVEQWNPKADRFRDLWQQVKSSAGVGIYRTVTKPHQWYLRPAPGAETVRLDTPERRVAGAWRLLRGEVRIVYDRDGRTLAIPALGFSIPLLVDRGLIIASGRLPERQSRHWTYHDIDPWRARHVARILVAKLEVTT